MKIGLFFGSFNPIHVGHLIIANHMAEYSDLDEVWFVVTPHNPHKKKSSLLDNRNRIHMVELAIENNNKLKSSDVEFDLPQPNYTSKTLAVLTEKHPNNQFNLIMGMDNLETLHKWHNYQYILKNHNIYVYPRMDYEKGKLSNHTNINIIDTCPIIQISSSFIRKSIKLGKNVSALMPLKSWEYLVGSNFYKK